jgi:hypothetical protein
MAPDLPPQRKSLGVRSWLGTVALAAALAVTPLAADDADKSSNKPPPGKAGREAALIEVRFTDNSTMKLALREERIEVATRYGKLVVPVAEIQRIEFGTRLREEDGQKIETAINNLGSAQYKTREAAQADLIAYREKAYSALLRATKHKDPEVIRRAEELLTQLRQTVPEDQLEIREFDVVSTDEMRMTGRIGGETFKVHTSQFGEQPLKLADIRGMRSLSQIAADTEFDPKNVIADPGSLSQYQGQIGKVLYVRVTGGVNPNMARQGFAVPGGPVPGGAPPGAILLGGMGGGTVWGTDVYTTDSPLALAAVHAGAVQMGQTAVVKVTIVPSPNNFVGSSRNGVNTEPYGQYPAAYTVTRVGNAARPAPAAGRGFGAIAPPARGAVPNKDAPKAP